MKKSIQCLVCLFLFTTVIQAQQYGQKQCSATTVNRTLEFDGSSESENIVIEVSEDTGKLHVGINSTIKSGFLTVELYDPKGNKKGNFSIESQMTSNDKKKELVCGQMQKYIDDPMKGKWTILLTPNKVKGDVSICTSMYDE